ncbi:leukocyte surface antigen CD53-like [Synchiropus picturatus]
MAQGCLRCLKYTMCVANFLCFLSGIAVLSFGIYMKMTLHLEALTPSLTPFAVDNLLVFSGIVITAVSFLGFLGALRENRCLLLTFFLVLFVLMLLELTAACLLLVYDAQIGDWVQKGLREGLKRAKDSANNTTVDSEWDLLQKEFQCCGIYNHTDWGDRVPKSCCLKTCSIPQPPFKKEGCLEVTKRWFEENFLIIGICVILICIIEVLEMCFAMTLFCHISKSGLGYKL